MRTVDSAAIRIYLSTEVTDRKMYTLMHDPQYRVEVARQQTTYNQPSYTGFYLASDIRWDQVPVPRFWAPGSVPALGERLDGYVRTGEVAGPIVHRLTAALAAAEHHPDAAALERFVNYLDHPTPADTVTEGAAASLRYQAERIGAGLS